LHYLQGKAELVTDLLPLLQEFHREKLAMMLRHQAGARLVGQYDANNTYQYVINREQTQLTWVATAIAELGGTADDQAEPARPPSGKAAAAAQAIFTEDGQDAQRFVDRWRPRIDGMDNARHAKMLRVIIGETLEQKRFFDQALAGRHDLLGRRGEQVGPSYGEVLPSRWIE
ncbi:MAG TPA: hypothetical protein VHT95_04455, partial [Vicinamibacterales bacterium]|nr:hypothetical protein [Vicinamibacterales bacterium]